MLGEENITCERISGLAMCGVNSDVCTINAAFGTTEIMAWHLAQFHLAFGTM